MAITVRDVLKFMATDSERTNSSKSQSSIPTKWGYVWVERSTRPKTMYQVAISYSTKMDEDFEPRDTGYRFTLDEEFKLLEGENTGKKSWVQILDSPIR